MTPAFFKTRLRLVEALSAPGASSSGRRLFPGRRCGGSHEIRGSSLFARALLQPQPSLSPLLAASAQRGLWHHEEASFRDRAAARSAPPVTSVLKAAKGLTKVRPSRQQSAVGLVDDLGGLGSPLVVTRVTAVLICLG